MKMQRKREQVQRKSQNLENGLAVDLPHKRRRFIRNLVVSAVKNQARTQRNDISVGLVVETMTGDMWDNLVGEIAEIVTRDVDRRWVQLGDRDDRVTEVIDGQSVVVLWGDPIHED